MNNSSLGKNILAIVGFIVVFSFLTKIIGGLLFFVLKIIIPTALIVWLVRYIRGDNNQYRHYR